MVGPKVSIVMPVHNGGRYFERALKSALDQTYRNIEIVIVNDGSNDDGHTHEICARYDALHDHVKYISQPNGGVASALNTALRHMSGDIFTWLSHDDLFEPTKTERQVDFYATLGRRDVMLFSDWWAIGPNDEILSEVVYDRDELERSPRRALFLGKINGITLFIPSYILHEFGGFDEQYRHVQDYDLWHRAIGKYDFVHMPERLIKYRIHPEQDSNKPAAVTEGSALWRRMLESCREIDRVQLFGSSARFYQRMADHLSVSPYRDVADWARSQADHAAEHSAISLILLADKEGPELWSTFLDVSAQSDLAEIIIADTSADGIRCPAETRRTVSHLRLPGLRRLEAFQAAALAASGDYIAFASPGVRFREERVTTQVREMQRAGATVSYAAWLSLSRRPIPSKQATVEYAYSGHQVFPVDAMIVHRSEFLGGLQLSGWSDNDVFIALSARGSPLMLDDPVVFVGAET